MHVFFQTTVELSFPISKLFWSLLTIEKGPTVVLNTGVVRPDISTTADEGKAPLELLLTVRI